MCPDFRQDIVLSSSSVIYLTFIRFLPSSLPESIEPPFHDSLLLSPDPVVMSITDQITDPLLALCIFFLHSKPTLLLPEKYATIPRSSLVLRQSLPGHCQVVAFPLCYLLSQGDCSLFIALLYSLCRSGVAISTAMAAGLAWASRILMAGKPPIGTDYRQELSRAPLTTAFLIETVVLFGRAVSAGGE
jgi:hypothetical protein